MSETKPDVDDPVTNAAVLSAKSPRRSSIQRTLSIVDPPQEERAPGPPVIPLLDFSRIPGYNDPPLKRRQQEAYSSSSSEGNDAQN